MSCNCGCDKDVARQILELHYRRALEYSTNDNFFNNNLECRPSNRPNKKSNKLSQKNQSLSGGMAYYEAARNEIVCPTPDGSIVPCSAKYAGMNEIPNSKINFVETMAYFDGNRGIMVCPSLDGSMVPCKDKYNGIEKLPNAQVIFQEIGYP